MILGLVNIGRVGLQSGRLDHLLCGAVGGSTQLNGAFGDGVYMTVDFLAKRVEHLVNGNGIRSFDVPVRLFRQQRQVNGIGKASVENARSIACVRSI